MSAPILLDRGAVAREYGFTRVDIDRIFRRLPAVALDGSRKVYVNRAALDALIERSTHNGRHDVRH